MPGWQKRYIPTPALGYNPAPNHAALPTPMSHDTATIARPIGS
jgi:hypothetical protein